MLFRSPTANAGLNATVGFRYDPVELNGVPETAQVLHIHMHDAVWHFLNGAVNTPQHLVTAAALDSLGLFTTYNGDLPTTVASAAHEDRMFLSPNIGETITLHVPDGMHATSVAIVDAKGASIREWSVALLTGDHVLPVADLASGVYRLRINGDTSIPFVRP